MPWAGNEGVDPWYVVVTWTPTQEDLGEAMDFAYRFPVVGLEYDDGLPSEAPFTDIPLESGVPYVRIYVSEQQYADIGKEVDEYCRQRSWPVDVRRIHSQDWANAWKAYYVPQWFSSDYVVVPSWVSPSPVDAHHTIWLDPGMAFGTGTHATTRMCVNALINLGPLQGKRVLDLGAGSGILSLIAARRGAKEVVAVEPDVMAREALEQNVLGNQEPRIAIVEGTLEDVPETPFDVLCLNLIWEIIDSEWERIQRYVAHEAILLLSGVLPEREQDIRRLIAAARWQLVSVEQEEGWLLAVVKNGSDCT